MPSLLHVLIFVPLLFAGAIAVFPSRNARAIATIGSLVPFGPLVVALIRFDWANGGAMQFASTYELIPDMRTAL